MRVFKFKRMKFVIVHASFFFFFVAALLDIPDRNQFEHFVFFRLVSFFCSSFGARIYKRDYFNYDTCACAIHINCKMWNVSIYLRIKWHCCENGAKSQINVWKRSFPNRCQLGSFFFLSHISIFFYLLL